MAEDQSTISQMRAVTISREYGSGGGEIAARLAKRLGWQLIDHEVVVRVAQELGVSEAEAEASDERVEGLISRFLIGLQAIQPTTIPLAAPISWAIDPQVYDEARRRVIEGAVAMGHVVIVGRGAQVLLAERRDVLHVRVIAPLEPRVAYVMRREGLEETAARARIQLKDRDRVRYLQATHRLNPEDSHLYDLVVNTGILDLDSAVDLIALALQRKGRRLAIPTGELGPGAGLARYPDQPGDFRPQESMTEPPM